jgi:hypothetical protein
VDAPGKEGNAEMSEQVKRSNPWRKKMMMMKIDKDEIVGMYSTYGIR